MTHLHTSVHVDHRVIVEQEKLLSVIFGCWGTIYKGVGWSCMHGVSGGGG